MPPPHRIPARRSRLIFAAALLLAVGAAAGRDAPGTALDKGVFLVAAEKRHDPNFAETVVLLIEYGPGGARGLVVNRRTRVKLSAVLPDMPGLEGRGLRLYYGGPVELSELVFLVNSASAPPESGAVLSEVHVTTSRETVEELLEQDEPRLRGYSGYAGWAPRQLDGEVERGDWHVMRARASEVFAGKPEEVWRRLIERASGRFARLAPAAG